MFDLSRRAFALFAVLLSFGAAPAMAQEAEVSVTPVPGFSHANLYAQAGAEGLPVAVILHGAEGGTEAGDRYGPILARLGYAVVGLPYYSPNWGEYGPPQPLPEIAGSFVGIRVD
jgi:dienelactone hydrolase